jgi:hypothetical protein
MPSLTNLDRVFAGGVILACLAALILQAVAICQQSLVADEPFFLFSGYRAARYGQNTLNLEHPPLIKMIAALPLLHLNGPDENPSQLIFKDASREKYVRLSSRFTLFALVAVPFLLSCFFLGYSLHGTRAGLVLAFSMAFSFDVLPYLAITQTDAAVSLGFMLTLAAAIQFLRQPTLLRAGLLGVGFGIALATKFSGLLLAPAITFALLSARDLNLNWKRRFASFSLVFGFPILILYGTYTLANWNYDSMTGRATISAYCQNQSMLRVDDHMRPYEKMLLRIEQIDPMAAQWLTGLLGLAVQNNMGGVWPSFVFGQVTAYGLWWFFPILILIRTPLALLTASVCGLLGWILHYRVGQVPLDPCRRDSVILLSLATGTYMAVALSTSYNMGVRHLLPIIPLLSLPAVLWAARRHVTGCILVGSLLGEAIALSPLWMSSTNTWWLGNSNPTQCAIISDCEYKQNFFTLVDAAHRRGIETLHIAFPLLTDAEAEIYFPGMVQVNSGAPVNPGWHAVSVFIEDFLPAVTNKNREPISDNSSLAELDGAWKSYREGLWSQGEDRGYIAGTFRLYYVPLRH